MHLQLTRSWYAKFFLAFTTTLFASVSYAAHSQAKLLDLSTLDGPTSAVQDVYDVSLAPDGDGAVVYVKDDAGQKHVFFARLIDGKLSGNPTRLDTGQANDSFAPSVAAGNGGKLIATWVNNNKAYAAYTPNESTAPGAPTQVGTKTNVSDISVDMNADGVSYTSLTHNNDVFAYRFNAGNWDGVSGEGVLDNNAANGAGGTMQEPRVAVTPQGNAFLVWSENAFDEAYIRKLTGTSASSAVRLDDFATLGGRSTANQASRKAKVQTDATGNAWVIFEQFADYTGDGGANSPRLVARKADSNTLALGTPLIADGLGSVPTPIGDGGVELPAGNPNQSSISINNAGNGLLGTYRQMGGNYGMGTHLNNEVVSNPFILLTADATNAGGIATAVAKEGSSGLFAWNANNQAFMRQATLTNTGSDVTKISDDTLGNVGANGVLVDADRFGNGILAFKQGTNRVVFRAIDQPPSASDFVTANGSQLEAGSGKVEWKAANEDWGNVTYIVKLNGKQVATTDQRAFTIPSDTTPGNYTVSIEAQDREGQTSGASLLQIAVKAKTNALLFTVQGKIQVKGNTVSFQLKNPSGTSAHIRTLLQSKRKFAVKVGKRTKKQIIKLGDKRFILGPGKTVTVRIPISKTGRRLLKRYNIASVLTISAKNTLSQKQTLKKSITLKKRK